MLISRENNFDLLRLCAALQVAIMHSSYHLNIDIGFVGTILKNFPGVPIFFTISGFLITMSLDKSKNLKNYFRNRFLRIFPALWMCFLITIILLFIFNILSYNALFTGKIWTWILSQISFFQFYTPEILRSWGVGTPNGSLWTIPVELQFYCLLPTIMLLYKKTNINFRLLIVLIILLISFFLKNYTFKENNTLVMKLIGVSVFPHLFNFLMGSILYLNWEKIRPYIENKALAWIVLYGAFVFFNMWEGFIVYFFQIAILSIVVLSFAFTNNKLSTNILHGNDISYGVYIYHMLVVNSIIQLGFKGNIVLLLITIFITIILAFLSWSFVEKKVLQLKNHY